MDSLISQLCLLPFPSLHLLPELLFSLHCHSLLLKESYMLYLFIFLSWSPHYNIQMVEKEGNFSVKLLQNLPFISSQILYFALFPRSVQSAFYPSVICWLLCFYKDTWTAGEEKISMSAYWERSSVSFSHNRFSMIHPPRSRMRHWFFWNPDCSPLTCWTEQGWTWLCVCSSLPMTCKPVSLSDFASIP